MSRALAPHRLPTFEEYLAFEETASTRHWRAADGAWWQVEHGGDDRVPLSCPDTFSIAVADMYRNVSIGTA